jgi:hypothetical protein
MIKLTVESSEVKVTKRTEVQKAKDKMEQNRELIMEMLGWDELTYGLFVMEKAEEYLKRQCGRDAYGIQALMESQIFWKWWKNHWMQRDEAFLYEWANYKDAKHLVNEYAVVHSAANLHMRPNKVILEDSYAKMIGNYLKGGVAC